MSSLTVIGSNSPFCVLTVFGENSICFNISQIFRSCSLNSQLSGNQHWKGTKWSCHFLLHCRYHFLHSRCSSKQLPCCSCIWEIRSKNGGFHLQHQSQLRHHLDSLLGREHGKCDPSMCLFFPSTDISILLFSSRSSHVYSQSHLLSEKTLSYTPEIRYLRCLYAED